MENGVEVSQKIKTTVLSTNLTFGIYSKKQFKILKKNVCSYVYFSITHHSQDMEAN